MEEDCAACTSMASNLETVVLSHDDESKASLNQSSFFRAIEEGNLQLLHILLKHHTIDINAYNDQGMTAVHLAVYKFETRRKLDVLELLLKSGINACLKAAMPPQASKLSIIRHDVLGHPGVLMETKKISLDHMTPLLLALELKSALYLRGWEYRHWDPVLELLANATVRHFLEKGVHEQNSLHNIPDFVKRGWNDVFESGDHSLVEVSAEGKELSALKLLLSGASKKLKLNIESMAVLHLNTLELKEISFTIAKAMVKFIYTGSVDHEFMEHRGVDLLQAAHKYGVDLLKALCEEQVKPTQDNWIKLLTVANESESNLLTLKCARSIEDVMAKRQESTHVLRKSFSESDHCGPNQLFQGPYHHHA
eukprot:c12143_g1_i1 orf=111-1208(-)